MEEDIKDLEKYIIFANKRENFSHDTDWKWNKELAIKIKNLINRNKELEEDNKKLTDEYMIQKHLINADFIKDYILKSKVKEKIEELEKNLERDRICIDFVIEHTKDIELMAEIKVLQELLEE